MNRDFIGFVVTIALLPLFALPMAPAVWLLMVAVRLAPMTWPGFFLNWLITAPRALAPTREVSFRNASRNPAPVMSIVADVIASSETHASLDSLFTYGEAPGDPPDGSKPAKALAWLRRVNKDQSVDPLKVLGRLIEAYMEVAVDPWNHVPAHAQDRKDKIEGVLSQCELQYVKGGRVVGALASPSRTLEQLIRDRDLLSINEEFDRALRNVESSPREAVSAACNLLEAVCKTYIQDEGLTMPPKQDLQPVWSVVRKDLGLDPSRVEERDLQEILSGMIAVVNGVGALRTHASSAHGAGRRTYRLEPRHARLAVHGAHTIALFVLESWEKKRKGA